MSSMSGQGAYLLSSFQSATKLTAANVGVVMIPAPANCGEGGADVVSIFRTTKK
jgi:hypothetical protein